MSPSGMNEGFDVTSIEFSLLITSQNVFHGKKVVDFASAPLDFDPVAQKERFLHAQNHSNIAKNDLLGIHRLFPFWDDISFCGQ